MNSALDAMSLLDASMVETSADLSSSQGDVSLKNYNLIFTFFISTELERFTDLGKLNLLIVVQF